MVKSNLTSPSAPQSVDEAAAEVSTTAAIAENEIIASSTPVYEKF